MMHYTQYRTTKLIRNIIEVKYSINIIRRKNPFTANVNFLDLFDVDFEML